MTSIENARNCAEKKQSGRYDTFDVAVTIVEGCMDDEPYRINYLRNVALLETRRQHLRFNSSLDKLAVLIVDVDFRSSNNLYDTVHSGSAVESILKQRRVIVCPAFESTNDNHAQTVTSLRVLVEARQAERFHTSHFSQGHTPTQFDKFWKKSLECDGKPPDEYWERSYKIYHHGFCRCSSIRRTVSGVWSKQGFASSYRRCTYR